ncbi:MAG: CpsD/CapB family tyrosine-protein kinase [Lachnospiraceae bacterium]|nr:CpsD/CapB family tyrosine-protein kinase [Lachnospiraceae bacterium]
MKRVNFVSGFEMTEETAGAYRDLCDSFLTGNVSRKIFLLTGHSAGEGTSFAAIRIATTCADMGKKVLLLDADMRRSALRSRLNLYGASLLGLSDYLSEKSSIEESVYSTDIPGLYIMPSGSLPKSPTELLGNERFRELLDIIRRVFDLVFIDTPPLDGSSDASIVATRADSAIIVAEAGRAHARDVRKVNQMMMRSRCPVEGVVLTKVKA